MLFRYLLSASALLILGTTACGDDGDDPCVGCPGPVSTAFEGVFGGNDGVEIGSLSLTLNTDGNGSGFFKIGSAVTNFTSVSRTGNNFTASGGGRTFTGTVNGLFIDGSYTGGTNGGLVAAMEKAAAIELIKFCATHDAGAIEGPYVFVLNSSTNAIRGAWTSGPVSGFKGIISGFAGDDLGVMDGHPGTVTILPDLQNGTVSGFYDLTSGEQGTMSGPVCP